MAYNNKIGSKNNVGVVCVIIQSLGAYVLVNCDQVSMEITWGRRCNLGPTIPSSS